MLRALEVTALCCAALTPLAASCTGFAKVVSLRDAARSPSAPPARAAALQILTRSTAVADPLEVRGSSTRFTDLESALGASVAAAVVPLAETGEKAPAGGLSLLVELTHAEAQREDQGRVVVGLEVRATLRKRDGNVYLGQTMVGCREGSTLAPDRAAPVFLRCTERIGNELAGWLAGGVALQ